MFGLFLTPSLLDPDLGVLTRSHRMWRGHIAIVDKVYVPLVLAGSKHTPDPTALKLAKSIPSQYYTWKMIIEKELIQHLAPYAEDFRPRENLTLEYPFPIINKPSDIWPHVNIEYLAVMPLKGQLTVELGYQVTWDEEHILGARFQNGQFMELCGSVLCP